MTWLSYEDLAWTDELFADQSDFEKDVQLYADMINRSADRPPATLLHLGCGAGGHDTCFKKYYSVTGVDLSRGMLTIARARHPELEYIEADMRTVRLGRQYDAVIIPDSIDYMLTEDDLRKAIETANVHLNPGGVLLVVAHVAERFQNNNFAYTGQRGDVSVTLFENNYVNP